MKDKTIYAESRSTIQKKKSFFEKVKEHRTGFIIAGVTIISIAAVIFTEKNRNSFRGHNVTNLLKEGGKVNNDGVSHVSEAIENAVNSITSNERIIDVRKHIRNLPEGWKPSSEKLNSAKKAGIILGNHQTWVDDYSKLCA